MTPDRPAKRRFVLFYSWQADLPNGTNRGFIHDALERASRSIRTDDSIDIDPVIDRDTVGVPGAPNIAGTIFEKIVRADAIVVDVSIISPAGTGRPSPNPNVLIELGYAIREKGWQRVLMVMNTQFGALELLPFDLRGHRVMTYRALPEESERSGARTALVGQLEIGIRALLEGAASTVGETVEAPSLTSQALAAIEAGRPNRTNLVRRCSSDITTRLVAAAPDLAKPQYDRPTLLAALQAGAPATADFARVAAAAAEMEDQEVAEELMRGLEPLLGRGYLPAGFSGNFWNHQFDFFRFIAWELLLILIGCLLRERRWDIIGRILTMRLYVNHSARKNAPDHVGIEYFGLDIQTFTGSSQLSEVGETLRALSNQAPLSEFITFEELQAADYLVFLRLDLPPPVAPEWPEWYGWAAVLLSAPPRFLIDALRPGDAAEIGAAIGIPGTAELQERLVERGRRFVKYYGVFAHRLNLFSSFDFSAIASSR